MRFLRFYFVLISIIFCFSSFVQADITPVALKNSKVLKYQNEKGKEVLFKVLKKSGYSTTYETNTEAFGEEYQLVGGIASSGGRPFNPRHSHLSNSIDEDNRSKIKNFLSHASFIINADFGRDVLNNLVFNSSTDKLRSYLYACITINII